MSKTTVVIVHGSFGNIDENWIPYAVKQLSADNCNVVVPQFPINSEQNFENWKLTFFEEVGPLREDMILVGHSIASAFILALLSESDIKLKGILLVSGFINDLGISEFDTVNHSFTHFGFDWDKIVNSFEIGYSFHGIDDPYVPLWMGEEIANKTDIELMPIENGGHLNTDAGFEEFPALLEKIREYL